MTVSLQLTLLSCNINHSLGILVDSHLQYLRKDLKTNHFIMNLSIHNSL